MALLPAMAEVVNVYEVAECGGATSQIAERQLETGRTYRTSKPPAKSGWIFTHWTISTQQAFENRDAWGRAFDENPFTLYETTTLTAHYLPTSTDTDSDGVADGHEIYWCGDIHVADASTDSDGDCYAFAQEIALGLNPLMADGEIAGTVRYTDGALNLYNPSNYGAVVVRSEPEGTLFTTIREVYRPGTRMSTTEKGVFDPKSTTFAYWQINGVRQADAWGRALDSTGLITDGTAMEIVAVCASDYETRMKLYWYGDSSVAMDSDTDGDGLTFAQELAAGTNPLMADGEVEGPVRYNDGTLLQYNPYSYQPYTLKSDPEGALFPTTNFYVRAGTRVTLGTQGSTFTYWVMNGVEQRDAWGRALDALTFTMPNEAVTVTAKATSDYETRMKLYWYGDTSVAMNSDTDGDGLTFAQELAAGSNPLMADGEIEGPVRWADSVLHEANLQPYEQVGGAVVDGVYVEFAPFFGGAAIEPVVADLNGDGLFDIVVERVATEERIAYINCGNVGNPQFEIAAWQEGWESIVDAAKLAGVEGFNVDVQPVAAVGYTMAGEDLLVSDEEGRIWYYKAQGEAHTLLHKVWGGSYPGFAEDLRISAVDWEDDGDWDCLCGTADGRLMLLRNPKVGRPTNVAALVGADNVLLAWDPNQQSRIRGYRVYRDDAPVAEPTLPRHRDFPEDLSDHDYQISSLSRHYTTGSSTPIVSESPRTEAVRVEFNKVSFAWREATAAEGATAEVMLAVENTMNIEATGTRLVIGYDPAVLTPLKIKTSGLTEDCELKELSMGGGEWSLEITSGKIAPGSGNFLTFSFNVASSAVPAGAESASTFLMLLSVAMKSTDGKTLSAAELPLTGAVIVTRPEEGALPAYSLGDVTGDGRIDEGDIRLLAKLKEGQERRPTAAQLRAGDFNGNGKLDNADYQALRALLGKGKE